MMRNPLILFALVIGLTLAVIWGMNSLEEPPAEAYCDLSPSLLQDLEFLGDMNVCMATVACRFGLPEVRLYREKIRTVNECNEKAKQKLLHEPAVGRP